MVSVGRYLFCLSMWITITAIKEKKGSKFSFKEEFVCVCEIWAYLNLFNGLQLNVHCPRRNDFLRDLTRNNECMYK